MLSEANLMRRSGVDLTGTGPRLAVSCLVMVDEPVYLAAAAHASAQAKRARPRTPVLAGDAILAAHVTKRLKAKDSPMTISIELARGVHGLTTKLNHEAIYQALNGHGKRGLHKGLYAKLHRRHRCRKHRLPDGETVVKSSPLGVCNLILDRPPEALKRSEVGHLESDLICGFHNRSAIVKEVSCRRRAP